MTDSNDRSASVFVHPTADVESGAQVGDGTKVWHLAHIRSSAQVGAGCVIGRNVYVDAGVTVGDLVKIQNNVSVYQGVTIEDEVFIGHGVMFTNDVLPRATTESGELQGAGDWKLVETLVQRGASIGSNATILPGITIGAHAIIGAGSVVTQDVPAGAIYAGVPARFLREV